MVGSEGLSWLQRRRSDKGTLRVFVGSDEAGFCLTPLVLYMTDMSYKILHQVYAVKCEAHISKIGERAIDGVKTSVHAATFAVFAELRLRSPLYPSSSSPGSV